MKSIHTRRFYFQIIIRARGTGIDVPVWVEREVCAHLAFKPQDQHAYSPQCSPYFSYGSSRENVHKQ